MYPLHSGRAEPQFLPPNGCKCMARSVLVEWHGCLLALWSSIFPRSRDLWVGLEVADWRSRGPSSLSPAGKGTLVTGTSGEECFQRQGRGARPLPLAAARYPSSPKGGWVLTEHTRIRCRHKFQSTCIQAWEFKDGQDSLCPGPGLCVTLAPSHDRLQSLNLRNL